MEAIQKFKCYSGTGSSSGNIIAFKGKIRKEDCAVECLASGCAAFTIQNSGNCVLKSAYKLETDGVDKGKLTCVRTGHIILGSMPSMCYFYTCYYITFIFAVYTSYVLFGKFIKLTVPPLAPLAQLSCNLFVNSCE